ncbi:MAG: DUF3459 domain-containing protein, partial [Nitrospinaceae bacterium]|nr:DUF3459 domain-containing protein [Nitrospinaceae bacterium]NIR53476.1 DUF3459 domain-containing protein [Nitrospinaceae bacterium]NIS83873.1 DUF3459 domain-containing protein [Nitrospinaceae bacterium]NIT80672.1 DUF3459 domain-containing protein [Nitrospinaceae bacterium]NIU42992.1 DUF3459 domain-containing protein [Nitrospinaceae bacterium]
FLKCKLNWKECDGDPHRGILKLYQDLLALRARDPALKRVEGSRFEVDVVGRFTLALRRQSPDHPPLLMVACLKEGDHVVLGKSSATQPGTDQKWTVEWTSQNPGYTTSPSSPKLLWGQKHQEIHFDRPCAVLLRAVPLEKA